MHNSDNWLEWSVARCLLVHSLFIQLFVLSYHRRWKTILFTIIVQHLVRLFILILIFNYVFTLNEHTIGSSKCLFHLQFNVVRMVVFHHFWLRGKCCCFCRSFVVNELQKKSCKLRNSMPGLSQNMTLLVFLEIDDKCNGISDYTIDRCTIQW